MKRSSFWLVLFALSVPIACFADSTDAGVLKSKCAMGHGPDGTGQTPMGEKLGIKSYKSSDIQKQSDADIKSAITNGKGKMPAYGKSLTPDQVGALVRYIRELGK
jgi:mono/diheme cytochrome c family protein